ncbi:MAG: phosphotransferase family protein [Spongiibacteraceae bacterium]
MTRPSENAEYTIVAPAVRDLDVLAAQLAEWLQMRMPGVNKVHISNLSYPLGAGKSHETILFDASWNEDGQLCEQGLVVRIKPTQHTVYQDDMFNEQYLLMQTLHELGTVRVAETLWFEEDSTLLGAPFFVMRKLEGRVAVSDPSYMKQGWLVEGATPSERLCMWKDAIGQLAAIQKVPLSTVAFLDRPQAGVSGFDQEWDRWMRYLGWIGENRPLPFLHAACGRLQQTAPANRPAGIVWGDARLGNMMIGADYRVAAVMDWEQTSLGGALHDLGWWLFHERLQLLGVGGVLPEGLGTREQTIALWSELTGLSTESIDWYEAFAAFKMGCLSVRMLDLKDITPANNDYDDSPMNRMIANLLDLPAPTAGRYE